jgi:hypothetical protein
LVPCTHMFETLKARVHGITKWYIVGDMLLNDHV